MRLVTSVGVLVSLPSLLSAQDATLRFAQASGRPGEVVFVATVADLEHPLVTFQIPFHYDSSRLLFLGGDLAGTDLAGLDPLALFHNDFGSGDGLIGLNPQARQPTRGFRVPPGEGRTLARLAFRIRADAAAGSAEVAPVTRFPGVSFGLEIDGEVAEMEPLLLGGGPVEVYPPQGPRPVGNLECVQILDRVRLTFTLTEPYDEITISRDGQTIAAIAGSESAFLDPLPHTGRLHYSVVASRDGSSSPPARCEVVATEPASPVVEDLDCGGDGSRLTWTNPMRYDRILVFLDGVLVAELPGDATFFAPQAGSGLAAYTVIAEAEGYQSPESTCVANGVWIIEAGDVLVAPGTTRVSVPMYITNPMLMRGFSLYLEAEPLEPLRLVTDVDVALAGTVTHPESEFIAIGYGWHGGPAAGVGGDWHPPCSPEKNIPPGLRQHVFNFVFDIEPGRFAEGDVVPVPILGGDFIVPVGDTRVRCNTQTSVQVEELVNGEIHFGAGEVAAPRDLDARVPQGEGGGGGEEDPGVSLSWTNAQRYDALRILRNATLVAELPGTADEFFDEGVPAGVFTYKVVGVRGGRTSFPAVAFLSTITPRGAFLRGDTNRDGSINLSDPVATLGFLFSRRRELPCEDAADADDDGTLTIADPVRVLNYLFRGTAVITSPGTRHPWFDPTPDALGCRE